VQVAYTYVRVIQNTAYKLREASSGTFIIKRVRNVAESFVRSVYLFVLPFARKNSATTGGIFINFSM
jgi:hypothetical protein